MVKPKFGFGISPGEPRGVAQEAHEAELMGYDRIGVWDSPVLFREPWVTLTSMATTTNTVAIGTMVTNPLSRHPVVVASSAATLNELAPKRVYIGIGTGGTGIWPLGLKTASLSQLEDYVIKLKELLSGREAQFGDHKVNLKWVQEKEVKIIVSAHGPAALKLAGRIGDGVVVGLGITPEVVKGSLDLISQGAAESGRTLSDLEIWFTCFWFVDEKPGVAKQQGSWAATSLASHFSRTSTKGKFVPDEFKDGLMKIGSIYDFDTHGNVPEWEKQKYTKYAEDLGILDYVRRRFAFCGQPDEVEQQIRGAMEAGATNFDGAIDAELEEHRDRITKFAKLVLPRFK